MLQGWYSQRASLKFPAVYEALGIVIEIKIFKIKIKENRRKKKKKRDYRFVDRLLITSDPFKMLRENRRPENPCISKQLIGTNDITYRKTY
jgi:hypothetical protein